MQITVCNQTRGVYQYGGMCACLSWRTLLPLLVLTGAHWKTAALSTQGALLLGAVNPCISRACVGIPFALSRAQA